MSAIWCRRISTRCAICAPAAPRVTLNCGYGRGYSVLEVIDAVKRVSGVDFRVDIADRRAGDPAQIVASSERARAVLGWKPQCDDLDTDRRPCARLGAQADERGTADGRRFARIPADFA